MNWAVLVVAGLLEIVWATALKHTDGFTRPWPTLPVGTAYAVWVGIGAVGVATVGIVGFGESRTPTRLAFIALIAVGIAGFKAIEG